MATDPGRMPFALSGLLCVTGGFNLIAVIQAAVEGRWLWAGALAALTALVVFGTPVAWNAGRRRRIRQRQDG